MLIYDTAKACIEAQEELFALVSKAELYDINQNDTLDENERQMALQERQRMAFIK